MGEVKAGRCFSFGASGSAKHDSDGPTIQTFESWGLNT